MCKALNVIDTQAGTLTNNLEDHGSIFSNVRVFPMQTRHILQLLPQSSFTSYCQEL